MLLYEFLYCSVEGMLLFTQCLFTLSCTYTGGKKHHTQQYRNSLFVYWSTCFRYTRRHVLSQRCACKIFVKSTPGLRHKIAFFCFDSRRTLSSSYRPCSWVERSLLVGACATSFLGWGPPRPPCRTEWPCPPHQCIRPIGTGAEMEVLPVQTQSRSVN